MTFIIRKRIKTSVTNPSLQVTNIVARALSSGVLSEEKMTFNENIPEELRQIYHTTGHFNELTLGDWHIMSPLASAEFNNEYKSRGCDDLYSFAHKYSGMGWIYLATVDLTNGKVFIRHDGGSNGYDTEANLQKSLKYRENFVSENYEEKLINIGKFLELCMNDDNEYQRLLLW